MKVRWGRGLFRIWVVFTLFWCVVGPVWTILRSRREVADMGLDRLLSSPRAHWEWIIWDLPEIALIPVFVGVLFFILWLFIRAAIWALTGFIQSQRGDHERG